MLQGLTAVAGAQEHRLHACTVAAGNQALSCTDTRVMTQAKNPFKLRAVTAGGSPTIDGPARSRPALQYNKKPETDLPAGCS